MPGAPIQIAESLRQAMDHHRAGRLGQAEALYRRVLQARPDHPDALHLLGLVAHQVRRNDAAVELIGRAIAIDPGRSEFHVDLGHVQAALGRLDEAAAAFETFLEKQPGNAVALFGLANVRNRQRRLAEAIACYRQVIALAPAHAEAHFNLGVSLQEQGKLAEAAAFYRRAIALKPDYAAAHGNLGHVLRAQGERADALAAYRRAVALAPRSADLHFNLHALLYDDRDPAAAATALERVLALDPRHTAARFYLGVIRDQQGDRAGAEAHFAQLGQDAQGCNAQLDSWAYAKDRSDSATRFFGTTAALLAYALAQARLAGLVLEFGVRFGTTIRLIAAQAGQAVHGFDSFAGLPEAWHGEQAGSYTTEGERPAVPDNVRLHAGWFDDTLPGFAAAHPGPIRFMNVDCDLYSSTRTVFDLLGDRVVPGTVIVFDEYLMNKNWRLDEHKAFQEAVAAFGWRYRYLAFSLFTKQAAVLITG